MKNISLNGWSVDYTDETVTINTPSLNGVNMGKEYMVRDGESTEEAIGRCVANRVSAFVKAMSYRWYAGPKHGN